MVKKNKMVIGRGLLAQAFAHYADSPAEVIFASGVSNSKQLEKAAFEREHGLLAETIRLNPEKRLVYFSTTSIEDEALSKHPYILHKKALESYIATHAKKYAILRLSNVVGTAANPYLVLNYLAKQVRDQQAFDLWHPVFRNLIDVDDVVKMVDYSLISTANQTLNICNPNFITALDLVNKLADFYGQKAIFKKVAVDRSTKCNTAASVLIAKNLGLDFGPTYIDHLFKKYL